MKIKDVIYKNRKKKQMTQEHLANQIEVSNKTISNWERGVTYPDILIVPKLCEVLDITINELFDVDDIIKIDGVIEYDRKQLTKFRTTLMVSMILMFFPITILLGVILESRLIYYVFIVLSVLSYVYSISTMMVSSINFKNHMQNNFYTKEYKKTLKNYNIIYITTLFTFFNFLLFLANNYLVKLMIGISINLIYMITALFLVKLFSYIYNIKEKLYYIIISLSLFLIGAILGILNIDVLGDSFLLIILCSTWLFVSSLLKLKERD